MNICLINHSFPPQIGGGETHMYLLAKGFSERGHKVTVITGGEDSSLRNKNNAFLVKRIKGFGDFEKGKSSFRSVLDELVRIMSQEYFDVVHVHNFMPGLAYASIFSSAKTKKTVFTFHSTPIPEEGKIIGHFSDYRAEMAFTSFIIGLPFYDELICPSQYYYDWALKLGCDKIKAKTIYHGVNEEDFSSNRDSGWRSKRGYLESDFIVVCPARMIYRKGILDIIKAINLLNNERIKLFIPTSLQNGSDKYFEKVKGFIQSNNLFHKVKIAVDEENIETMPQVFANCDVCVLPSHIEGLGIVLLEAMAAGIPVIGADTFGINEVIEDNVNGLLFKLKTPEDLAEKILTILGDDKLRNILIRGGKESIRLKFSLSRQLDLLEEAYK